MKRIAIDISPNSIGHKNRGIGTYVRELQDGLEKLPSNYQLIFTNNLKGIRADLVHYPYFDLFFHTLPIIKSSKRIVTIHDVIPLKYPNYFPVGLKGTVRFNLQKLALKNVDAIITDSQASKNDIADLLSQPLEKIYVTYLAASDAFAPVSETKIRDLKKKYNLPEKFILFVGSLSYNKNVDGLIRAVSHFGKLPLVISTQTDIHSDIQEKQTRLVLDSVLNALDQAPENLIRVVKMQTAADLKVLYAASNAYIQPSLSEGFGLPVLEAMKSGVPVISSDQSSLPEVGGSAAIYFNPWKEKSIIKALSKLLGMSEKERKQTIEKGKEQANKFSWLKTAQETFSVYAKVLESDEN